MKWIFFALLVVSGLNEGGTKGVGLPAPFPWFYLCTAVWLHLHDSVSPRIHLPPLSSHPSASLLSYASPPRRQTQCQHDVGLAQCVGLMGKEKPLNMQKGLFNPHFFDSFLVVQHYQLNLLILEISFSTLRLDFRHFKTFLRCEHHIYLVCDEFICILS